MSRTRVLRFALSLRYVMLIASFTAALGALVMFWEAGGKMVAATVAALSGSEPKPVIALVMGGTDVLLFGIVLVIFAYTIALGFVYNLKPEERDSLPSWMRSTGMDEMKARLVGVILVYLVVDFATDWAENPTDQTWIVLAKPVSILLIAAAFRLFANKEPDAGAAADQDRPA
jgi:uncharacterized membrane protein YqhA